MSYYQQIYNRLRHHGITQEGALGVLGNFDCESNCEPFRLQGDFSPYRTASKAYVSGVTNGSISRDTFAHDAKGFGLYQLTYWSRKQGYYDFWKSSGKALDSAELQTDYAVLEMKRDFPNLYAFLCSTKDVFTATSRICREFERPAVNNINARFASAKRIQHEINLGGGDQDPDVDPQPVPNPQPVHDLELRVIDKNCTGWPEVWLLQALLLCRGIFDTNPDGIFGSYLDGKVKQFQAENGLSADGIVGGMTWAKLFERR